MRARNLDMKAELTGILLHRLCFLSQCSDASYHTGISLLLDGFASGCRNSSCAR